jgi:hypothetical protein
VGVLVREQDAGIVDSSVCDHERDCAGAFFAAAGGIAGGDVDYELGDCSGNWQNWIMAGFCWAVVDGATGKSIGIFMDVVYGFFSAVADGAGVFVCEVLASAKVSDFG